MQDIGSCGFTLKADVGLQHMTRVITMEFPRLGTLTSLRTGTGPTLTKARHTDGLGSGGEMTFALGNAGANRFISF